MPLWMPGTTSRVPTSLLPPPHPTLPLCFAGRLVELEVAVLNPGGDVDKIQARLRDLEDRQAGHAVSMGGYSFKDTRAVEAWLAVIGDDEVYRFAMDFKAQIVACSATSLTISDTIHNRASAAKAGYGSW